MASNKEDYGSFGKGIDKRGRPYYYLKNSKGGFGVTSIPEAKFKELLKKKIQQDKQEAKLIERELAKSKKQEAKKASKEEARLVIERAKATQNAMALSEKLRQEARKKKVAAGMSLTKVSEKQQTRAKLDGLYADLAKDATHVNNQYLNLMSNYDRLSQDKNYKVVSGRLLRLSTEYQKLDGEMDNVLRSIKSAKQFDVKFQEQINKFLERIEVLDIRLNAVLIEVDKTIERVEKEKASRDLKAQQKRNAIDVKNKARDAAKQSRDNARAEKEKARDDKKQNLQKRSATRARRIDLVQQGRARQEQARIRFEEAKEAKINALQKRQGNLAKFFDPSRSPMLGAIGAVGGLGGKVLGGIGKGLGFDFSTEEKILSGLFKGVAGIGRFGLKGVHSLTRRAMGLDDKSIENKSENVGDASNPKNIVPSQKNPKSVPMNNNSPGSSGGKLFSIKQGLSSISNKTSNLFSNAKSFFGGNKNSNSTTNSNVNSIRNDKFQNTDFNRTDDNIDKQLVSPIVDLLEKILKELKKEGDEKKKSGMFGGIGKAGLYGAVALGGVMLSSHIKDEWSKMFKEHQETNNTKHFSDSTTKEVMLQKLKTKDATSDDIEEFASLMDQESNMNPESVDLYPRAQKKVAEIKKRKKEIIRKYFKNNSSIDNSVVSNLDSISSNFRDTSSVSTTIKAQGAKIEKIQDTKDDQDGRMDRLQKWFSDVFIPKMADAIAGSLSVKKTGGGSVMPSVRPF